MPFALFNKAHDPSLSFFVALTQKPRAHCLFSLFRAYTCRHTSVQSHGHISRVFVAASLLYIIKCAYSDSSGLSKYQREHQTTISCIVCTHTHTNTRSHRRRQNASRPYNMYYCKFTRQSLVIVADCKMPAGKLIIHERARARSNREHTLGSSRAIVVISFIRLAL